MERLLVPQGLGPADELGPEGARETRAPWRRARNRRRLRKRPFDRRTAGAAASRPARGDRPFVEHAADRTRESPADFWSASAIRSGLAASHAIRRMGRPHLQHGHLPLGRRSPGALRQSLQGLAAGRPPARAVRRWRQPHRGARAGRPGHGAPGVCRVFHRLAWPLAVCDGHRHARTIAGIRASPMFTPIWSPRPLRSPARRTTASSSRP